MSWKKLVLYIVTWSQKIFFCQQGELGLLLIVSQVRCLSPYILLYFNVSSLTCSVRIPEVRIIDFGSACMENRTVYSYIQVSLSLKNTHILQILSDCHTDVSVYWMHQRFYATGSCFLFNIFFFFFCRAVTTGHQKLFLDISILLKWNLKFYLYLPVLINVISNPLWSIFCSDCMCCLNLQFMLIFMWFSFDCVSWHSDLHPVSCMGFIVFLKLG